MKANPNMTTCDIGLHRWTQHTTATVAHGATQNYSLRQCDRCRRFHSRRLPDGQWKPLLDAAHPVCWLALAEAAKAYGMKLDESPKTLTWRQEVVLLLRMATNLILRK